jgi:SSS family solute:Na+ symporter/sodium/proline symporter
MNTLLAVVVLYPMILLGVSLWRSRSVKSHDDFMVAGRAVPVPLLVGTLVCTWIGSGSLFGGAGLAYRTGIAELWFSSGGWLGLIVAFIILAYVTIAAYQFRGGGWILSIVSDGAISPETGMYITAIVIVLFTAAAGMVSIVTVDVFNGIIITLGVLFALPYMVFELGGVGAVTSALPAQHMEPLGGHNVLWVFGVAAPTFLLILGESGMYQKFFSAKNENAARKAVLGMVAGIVIIEVALALLAIVGRAAFPDLMESTSIVILLAAAVAIVLSTGNTFLLVPSTNVSRDLYQRFVNPEASEPRMLLVQRLSIAAFGVLALLLITQFDTILAMALYAYSLVGASLTPALLAAFLWRRVTVAGGVACLAGGLATLLGIAVLSRLGVDFALTLGGTEFDFASSDYIVIPGVLVSTGLMVAVSLLTPPSPRYKWEPFFVPPGEGLEEAIEEERRHGLEVPAEPVDPASGIEPGEV